MADHHVQCPLCFVQGEQILTEVRVIRSIDMSDNGPVGNFHKQYAALFNPEFATLYALLLCHCRFNPTHIFWVGVGSGPLNGSIYVESVAANARHIVTTL